ncbi:relaxase/mobilization nuclease domain-containing protein [Paucibacter sp. B51]|uniref:relaxase/mobilization nuclease domain-containing protein n=1 Tax=Paucibacter sp. B51 TaxID=2993315 RepID=UPI0022EBDE22|nr:conjugal transfer protein TraS [Paucibacter sp. B51]
MNAHRDIDGVLVQWGDRLFYPGNRMLKVKAPLRLGTSLRSQAKAIRNRIEAAVVRRSPQVMLKVTGGGRGMGGIAAHFRYISKNGRLTIEDDRGSIESGKEAVHAMLEQWRFGGSLIDENSPRREAFNLVLSMPRGTAGHGVLQAAREFARIELKDHRYVMVLHEHQENPHVHLCVRAESMDGVRLNPRKSDLHRWRETFAERLRGLGIDAEATRQASRGEGQCYPALWQTCAQKQGRLKKSPVPSKSGEAYRRSRVGALEAWAQIGSALRLSDQATDRELAIRISSFLRESMFGRELAMQKDRGLRSRTPLRSLAPVDSQAIKEAKRER